MLFFSGVTSVLFCFVFVFLLVLKPQSFVQSFFTRDGTAEPNPSRETKFSGANADREVFSFPVQLTTSRIDNLTRLIHTLAICVTFLYMHAPQQPHVVT